MLQTHVDIVHSGKQTVVGCVVQLYDEVRNDRRVIPALNCIEEICLALPAEPEDDTQRRSDIVYRREMMTEVSNNLSVVNIVIENLHAYMNKARHHQFDHPTVSPEKFRLDKHYSHFQQLDTRLRFILFWLKDGGLYLASSHAKTIWSCLFDHTTLASDKKACLEWFEELMAGEADLERECHQDFFDSRILKMDPTQLTETGLNCFLRFFEEINANKGKLEFRQGHRITENLQLDGLDYLWRVIVSGPAEVAKEAAFILVKIHVDLSPALMPNRDPTQKNFIASCVERLKANYNVLSNIPTHDENISSRTEFMAIDRIIAVLREYVAYGVLCGEPPDNSNSFLEHAPKNSL